MRVLRADELESIREFRIRAHQGPNTHAFSAYRDREGSDLVSGALLPVKITSYFRNKGGLGRGNTYQFRQMYQEGRKRENHGTLKFYCYSTSRVTCRRIDQSNFLKNTHKTNQRTLFRLGDLGPVLNHKSEGRVLIGSAHTLENTDGWEGTRRISKGYQSGRAKARWR